MYRQLHITKSFMQHSLYWNNSTSLCFCFYWMFLYFIQTSSVYHWLCLCILSSVAVTWRLSSVKMVSDTDWWCHSCQYLMVSALVVTSKSESQTDEVAGCCRVVWTNGSGDNNDVRLIRQATDSSAITRLSRTFSTWFVMLIVCFISVHSN